MIFITLGSQKFQFDRLLKAVDELVADGAITEPVFAQSGYSDYQPKHYEFKQFLDRDEFTKRMGEADLVITHGGTGAIIGAVKKGKKVIAVPRLAKYGEHVDDHQLQLLKEFKQMDIICVCAMTAPISPRRWTRCGIPNTSRSTPTRRPSSTRSTGSSMPR